MDEGYIKFKCDWSQSEPLSHKMVQDLISFRQKAHERNWIGVYPNGIGFGNISQRFKENQFIISGSSTGSLKVVDESHFTKVDYFNLNDNHVHCIGPIIASSESMSHGVLYSNYPEINAVIHIHHLESWTKLKHNVLTTPDDVPYGSPEMAQAITKLISESNSQSNGLFVMAGHEEGIIAFGKSLQEAWNQLVTQIR